MSSVRIPRRLFFCMLLTVTAVPGSPSQTNAPTLKKVAEFDLPGPRGKRFDYLTIDEDDRYLISAHLAADQTYVIDLDRKSTRLNSSHEWISYAVFCLKKKKKKDKQNNK